MMIGLEEIVKAFNEAKLEAILIGNSAAVEEGVVINTFDYDFFIRDYEKSKEKIKNLAKKLDADMVVPDRAVTSQIILENPKKNLYIDIIDKPAGMKHFASTRSRSFKLDYKGNNLVWCASLEDIIASKKSLGRDKDLAALPILEKTLKCKQEINNEK